MSYTVYDCSVIKLPRIENRAGNITAVHGNINLPFDIKRVFYSYDIPGGEARGAHAHKECHQFLVAASGAFEVVLDDGVNKRTVLWFTHTTRNLGFGARLFFWFNLFSPNLP
jgi:hypothetical protein